MKKSLKKSLKLKYVYKGSDWEVVFRIDDDWNETQIEQFAISEINRRLRLCPGDCEFALLYWREDKINSKTEIQYYRCYNVIEKPQTKPTKAWNLYTTSSGSSGGSRVSYSTTSQESMYNLEEEEQEVVFPYRPNFLQPKEEVSNQNYKGTFFQTIEEVSEQNYKGTFLQTKEEESDDEDNSEYKYY